MKDSFGRPIEYLRLSVTDLCNLRCKYCMGKEGVQKKAHEEMLTEEEMIMAVRASVECGVKKVRITGGEPLVKPNIVSICQNISKLEGIKELGLTTNGTLLKDKARYLKEAGVDRINISLDTLDAKKYESITGGGDISTVMEGLEEALKCGFKKIKINTVLIGGFNDDEIEDMARLTLKYPIDVRFIELMPMDSEASFDKNAYISAKIVEDRIEGLANHKETDGVAKLYSLENGLGKVGLITPISELFCDKCNRIRITADGKIKPCLHSNEEYKIKGLSEEEMLNMIKIAISYKPKSHEISSCTDKSKAMRSMNRIGG